MSKIIAIIVTFNPNFDWLIQLVDLIQKNVDVVIVIDNGTFDFEHILPALTSKNVFVRRNENNLGVATAYNQGIKFATELNAKRIVLFDQDSYPDGDMIANLGRELDLARLAGLKVAAVGPKYYDAKFPETSPFVRIEGFRLGRVSCSSVEVVQIDHLISSGCMIDIEVFFTVGLFEEKLFIDYVDTEWCLRAKAKGFILLGVGAALMRHNLGDSYLTFFSKRIPQHSALRHYYLMRNGTWLLGQPWVGWRWRILDGMRLFKIFLFFSTCGSHPAIHFKMMLLGIQHSMRSKMGKHID
ncbi:MAG: glycosyltransferase family 2 protein [Pseudomonadota bacterium]